MDLSKLAQNIYKYYYPYFKQYQGVQLFPKEYQQGIDLIPYRDINIDVRNLPNMMYSRPATGGAFSG